MRDRFHSAALAFSVPIWHHWHTLTGKVYGKVFSFSGPDARSSNNASFLSGPAHAASKGVVFLQLHQPEPQYVFRRGETEKNLGKLFESAELSDAILFFDEADAVFGKRSEVRGSHDRFANIDTELLLERIEKHQGIVILATNRKSNIDDVFLRRVHHIVEFHGPDQSP